MFATALAVSLAIVIASAQAQAPQTAAAAADGGSVCEQSGRRPTTVSARRARRQRQRRPDDGARGCREYGTVRSRDVEVRPGVQSASRLEDLESGEAEDDSGRQGHRRHGVQLNRSRNVLRDGERGLRLRLDRDAAQLARLGVGRQNVGRVSAREGCAGSPRRVHRRARDSARARRWRARARGADGRHRCRKPSKRGTGRTFRRSDAEATAAGRRSTRPCGAAYPAATATRSTTTSCSC